MHGCQCVCAWYHHFNVPSSQQSYSARECVCVCVQGVAGGVLAEREGSVSSGKIKAFEANESVELDGNGNLARKIEYAQC